MREIVIYDYCDRCWHEQEEQRTLATTTFTFGLNEDDRPHPVQKVLRVCELHAVEIKQLLTLLNEVEELPARSSHKASPSKAAAAPDRPVKAAAIEAPVPPNRDEPCPVCRAVYPRPSMSGHVWGVHVPFARPSMAGKCPECRAEYGSGAGMSSHRRLAHGWDALAEALAHVPNYKPRPSLASPAAPAPQLELEAAT